MYSRRPRRASYSNYPIPNRGKRKSYTTVNYQVNTLEKVELGGGMRGVDVKVIREMLREGYGLDEEDVEVGEEVGEEVDYNDDDDNLGVIGDGVEDEGAEISALADDGGFETDGRNGLASGGVTDLPLDVGYETESVKPVAERSRSHALLTRSSEYFLSLIITYTFSVASELSDTLLNLDEDDQWFLTSLPSKDTDEIEGGEYGVAKDGDGETDGGVVFGSGKSPQTKTSSDLLFRRLASIPTHRFKFLFQRSFPSGLTIDEHCGVLSKGSGSSALTDADICGSELRFIVGKCLQAGREGNECSVFSLLSSSPTSSSSVPDTFSLNRCQFVKLAELHFWARNELVKHNLRLVASIVSSYANRASMVNKNSYTGAKEAFQDELYQEGILGLIRAAEKYDGRTGNRFSTYATTWINAYVRRCQYRENWGDQTGGIRVPDRYYGLNMQANKFRKVYEATTGRQPSSEEVRSSLGVTKGVMERLEVMKGVKSIDEQAYRGGGKKGDRGEGGREFAVRDKLTTSIDDDPAVGVDVGMFHDKFKTAMSHLNKEEVAVVRSRLGVEGGGDKGEGNGKASGNLLAFNFEGRTYKEVCAELGMEGNAKDVGRIRKIYKSAVGKIMQMENIRLEDFRDEFG